MKDEELRRLVREQLEWCEAFFQMLSGAEIRESLSSDQVCVYVTAGAPPSAKAPPPHRYLHVVSAEKVEATSYSAMLKDETEKWNRLTDKERIAAAEARVGTKWEKQKIVNKLSSKGFIVKREAN